MEIDKRLDKIEEKIQEISKKLDHSIINKAKKYDEIISLLSNINISANVLKKTNLMNGEDYLLIEYKISPTKILCNDDGEIDCDNTFYSLNMLNLLDLEFVKEAQKEIEILKMSKK